MTAVDGNGGNVPKDGAENRAPAEALRRVAPDYFFRDSRPSTFGMTLPVFAM